MFIVNEDLSINVTRGDTAVFTVSATESSGENYLFKNGDVIRIKVTDKKACENVIFQKDFAVTEETETVELFLTEEDTKIGEVISKPKDYWYEIELNPLTNPQTIIGYDDDGAKIFKLFPEGKDLEPFEPSEEDIPVVDEELDITSERPVQNQAITRAMLNLQEELERVENTKNITSEDLKSLAVGIEGNKGNIAKNTGNIEILNNTLDTHTSNKDNPHNVTARQIGIDNSISGVNANEVQGAIDEVNTKVDRLYGVEKIDFLQTFTTPNYEYVYYNYTASKRCIIHLNCHAYCDNSSVIYAKIAKNYVEQTRFWDDSYPSAVSLNASLILEKGEFVEFSVNYKEGNTQNQIRVTGYVQYLE